MVAQNRSGEVLAGPGSLTCTAIPAMVVATLATCMLCSLMCSNMSNLSHQARHCLSDGMGQQGSKGCGRGCSRGWDFLNMNSLVGWSGDQGWKIAPPMDTADGPA